MWLCDPAALWVKTYQMHLLPFHLPALLLPPPSFFLWVCKKNKQTNLQAKNKIWPTIGPRPSQKRAVIKYDVTSVHEKTFIFSSPLCGGLFSLCQMLFKCSSAGPNVCTRQITTCRTTEMFNNGLITRTDTHAHTHTLGCACPDSLALQAARLWDQRLLRPVPLPGG